MASNRGKATMAAATMSAAGRPMTARRAVSLYEKALREAGVTTDDMGLLRELAKAGRDLEPVEHSGERPTRIYL